MRHAPIIKNPPEVNCAPFVRQHIILSDKWGAVYQKQLALYLLEHETLLPLCCRKQRDFSKILFCNRPIKRQVKCGVFVGLGIDRDHASVAGYIPHLCRRRYRVHSVVSLL